MKNRIFLSPPHLGTKELEYVQDAFATNYIAQGPQVEAFEREFAAEVGAKYAAAVSAGTAALHLALRYLGVGPGDEVICSTFTFVASANAILYQGATPLFIDSETASWNMDPELLALCLRERAAQNRLPKAVVVVHLYGQAADMDRINAMCTEYQVPVIEDAAEALGARYKGQHPGTLSKVGIFSFNGNKIITTGGGGMLVSDDEALIDKARFWATQARDPRPHYEHSEMGYNYRLSNVLAALGRGQLQVLNERVQQKRALFAEYQQALADLPGVRFTPEPEQSFSTRWLSCMLVDPRVAGIDRDRILQVLAAENIEARPTWKPMHLQPLFQGCAVWGGPVSEQLFAQGLCLPSGTAMTPEERRRVVQLIRGCW